MAPATPGSPTGQAAYESVRRQSADWYVVGEPLLLDVSCWTVRIGFVVTAWSFENPFAS